MKKQATEARWVEFDCSECGHSSAANDDHDLWGPRWCHTCQRTVWESAAPLLVADSLLTGADELKFLDQIARDQRIAVIATIADEGQLRM